VVRLGVVRLTPKYARKLIDPVGTMFLQAVVGVGFEPPEDFRVCPLRLTVASGVCHRGKAKLDANVFTISSEEVACELGPVVGDEPVRDPEPAHDGLEERNG